MTKMRITLLSGIVFLLVLQTKAQPYFDVASVNYQHFSLPNPTDASIRNHYENYAFSVFVPKPLKSGPTLLFRVNGETLQSSERPKTVEATSVTSLSTALGCQWQSPSAKWKSVLIVIPKLAGDFQRGLNTREFQYGAMFLEHLKLSEQLQVKAGLYFNKEAFGDFWVPLLGVDWSASDRWQFFGLLPNSYKIEYALQKKKWYAGLNFKAVTRSFALSGSRNPAYIRFDEVVLKAYLECYFLPDLVGYAEVGRSFGKPPLAYDSESGAVPSSSPDFQAAGHYTLFSFGLAYRIRSD